MVQPTISRLDFCIFALPLAVPAFIAIYFGLIRKQKDNNAYLVGNRSLSALPMSFSLALSFLTTTIVSGKINNHSLQGRFVFSKVERIPTHKKLE